MSVSATLVTESLVWLNQMPTSFATARPTATATTTVQMKEPKMPEKATVAPIAAMAVFRATRAVASLTRLSPSSTVTTRRGRPIDRATAVAATASGGATMAPMASATAQPTGSSSWTTMPTPKVVNSTRPTLSQPIAEALRRKSTSEVCTADE